MLLTFIGAYLLLTILIGYWASRRIKSSADFVVAGRKLPLLIAGSALFATWFGSETIMGASSEFVEHGVIGIIEDPFGAALCLILVGLFFARPLYRMNILTFNDYFNIRFNRRVEWVSALFMVPSYFGWIAAQLVAMAIILQVLAGIPIIGGIWICTIIVVIYTYIGGMWAVSITDFMQTVVIIAGLLFLAIQLFGDVGSFEKLTAVTPDGFFDFWPERDMNSILAYVAAWITIGLGSIPQQDVFQRTMSAKNEKTAVRAAFMGGFMYLTIGSLPLFIGLCSLVLYPELHQGADAQMILPQVVLQHSSLGMQAIFFGAILSAILSTTSGAILAPASVIGKNLLKPNFPHWTDKQFLQAVRFSVVGVAFASALMAMMNANIYELVGQSSALSLVSLFVPLVAGLYWKKATSRGAMASMVVGMGTWIICEWIIETTVPALIYGLIASILGMVIGSLFFKKETTTPQKSA
jgi:SSS family transporter